MFTYLFYFIVVLVFFYVIFDINYFIRTFFTVLSSRLQRKCSLEDITTIYGVGTLLDCDVWFKNVRLARLVRELDFARYHYYDRTGIYERSCQYKIKSLQGCTMTLTMEPLPIFCFYKINTKLIYWDEKSLFFEHEVETIHDARVRCMLVSRQHAIGENGDSTKTLLAGIPGSENRPRCPDYIKLWLESMAMTSERLRVKK